MNVVLLSTYELGRQPFGLASPAAWLRSRGHQVTTIDLAISKPSLDGIRNAHLIAFFLPMHTATRLALPLIPRVRSLNAEAVICAYGLYAALAEVRLRELGITACFGGEFEAALSDFADTLTATSRVDVLERLRFEKPDRSTLPVLSEYAKLVTGERKKTAGYTEASRGCKHTCRTVASA